PRYCPSRRSGGSGFCLFVIASPPPSAAVPPAPRSLGSNRSSAPRSTLPQPVLLPCYRSPSRRDFSTIPFRDSPSETPNRRSVSRRETRFRIPLGSLLNLRLSEPGGPGDRPDPAGGVLG